MTFTDRTEAGGSLAVALSQYAARRPVVVALPNGGLPVAAAVAGGLHATLDVVLVGKMRTEGDPGLVIGAVANRGEPAVVWNPWALKTGHVSTREMQVICDGALEDLERRRRRYVDGHVPSNLTGEAVILVDDGAATGASMRAAIKAVRAEEPALLIVALPVASAETLSALAEDADAVICLEAPERLTEVASHYRHFPRIDDEAAAKILEGGRR